MHETSETQQELTERHCDYCLALIVFVRTRKGMKMPASAIPWKQTTPPSLKDGKYIDLQGNLYDAADVPMGLPVYRTHWQDCSGAKETRRK